MTNSKSIKPKNRYQLAVEKLGIPPQPVKRESRICFGISWFSTEEEAMQYSTFGKEMGNTYNGGFYHGMSCGRSRSFDIKDDGGKTILFAVTD